MKKNINHSVSKERQTFLEQKTINPLAQNYNSQNRPMNYERRCHTPSIMANQKKSKSRPKESKQKLSEKKTVYYSIKNFKPQTSTSSIIPTNNYHSNLPITKDSKPSPFKHKHTKNKSSHMDGGSVHFVSNISTSNHQKSNFPAKSQAPLQNKPAGGIANARHVRNLESQLSHLANLSDSSIFKQSQHRGRDNNRDSSLYLGQSGKKSGHKSKKHITSHLQQTLSTKQHPLMTQGTFLQQNQGKSFMKSHHFEEAIKVFSQLLTHLQSTSSHSHSKNHSTDQSPTITTTQCHYLTGVCYFHLGQYQKVVQELTQVIGFDQQYRKNVYLFLGIAYKKLSMIEEALLVLGKALTLYPKYLDVLLLRAKILSKQKRFYDSVQDLNKCIQLQPGNIQAYISKADCLRNLTQFREAINIYTEVLGKQKPNLDILLKRAITYIQNQQIEQALIDLNRILSSQPKNSQAYLFKGLAYTRQKNYNQSILSYEQAIKFNTSKKATTKALYEIAKLKIQIGDFYGAAYTLQRGSSLDIDLKVIEKLKIFVDGATFIMKKKYKRGIELLNVLGKKQHLNQMIRSLLYSFRAYAHFCINKYASALTDLKQLIKAGFVLDAASEYNMTLLQGIIKCQNNQFSQAMDKFIQAGRLKNDFGDPQMFRALTKIAEYNRTPKLRQKNTHLLQQALKFINNALQKQQNFNYFYLSALVLYLLKDYQSALVQLQQAIQGSDVHVLKHFYLRAMINAMQSKYQECFTDLNNVLSVSKELKQKDEKEVGKQSRKQEREKDKFYGEFQDLLNQDKQILQVYLNRAKCYLIFGQKKKAFQDLQTYIGQKPMDSSIHLIAGKLLFSIGAYQDAIKAFNYSPSIDKNKDALLSRTKCYIYLKQLNLSLKDMEKLLELGDKNIEFDFYCLSALKQASKSEEENFRNALQKISLGESSQIKTGHIFSLSDLFFYKGLFYFLLEQYQNAKKFMTKSKNLKKLNNQLQTLNENKDMTEDEYEQLFQNKIFTDKQIDYNLGLCELLIGNLAKAEDYLGHYEGFEMIFDQKEQRQEKEQEISLTPFPTSNRLCSIFPELQYSHNKKFRLSFDLPAVHSPPIVFETQYKLIEQISMSSIQSRPDAPWIKRNKFGVVFTTSEELLKVEDVDIRTERSNNDAQNCERIQKEKQDDDELDFEQEHGDNTKEKRNSSNKKGNQRNQKQKQKYQERNSYLHKFQQEEYQVKYQQNLEKSDDNDDVIEKQQKSVNRKEQLRQMFELDLSVEKKLNRLLNTEKQS